MGLGGWVPQVSLGSKSGQVVEADGRGHLSLDEKPRQRGASRGLDRRPGQKGLAGGSGQPCSREFGTLRMQPPVLGCLV